MNKIYVTSKKIKKIVMEGDQYGKKIRRKNFLEKEC